MTRTADRHERKTAIAQPPNAQLSFARPLEHIDFPACFINQFAPRDQLVALSPR
jgi:hypothetical protein